MKEINVYYGKKRTGKKLFNNYIRLRKSRYIKKQIERVITWFYDRSLIIGFILLCIAMSYISGLNV